MRYKYSASIHHNIGFVDGTMHSIMYGTIHGYTEYHTYDTLII